MKISEHFNRHEFACRCIDNCGCDTVDALLLQVLEAVRDQFKAPVTITSAHRCERHNAAVMGRPTSLHLAGRAADIKVRNHGADVVASWLRSAYPHRLGIGEYTNFVHVDSRTGVARWEEI